MRGKRAGPQPGGIRLKYDVTPTFTKEELEFLRQWVGEVARDGGTEEDEQMAKSILKKLEFLT